MKNLAIRLTMGNPQTDIQEAGLTTVYQQHYEIAVIQIIRMEGPGYLELY